MVYLLSLVATTTYSIAQPERRHLVLHTVQLFQIKNQDVALSGMRLLCESAAPQMSSMISHQKKGGCPFFSGTLGGKGVANAMPQNSLPAEIGRDAHS